MSTGASSPLPSRADRSGPPAELSSDEVAAVLRRAAELDGDLDRAGELSSDRIELVALEQAAVEAGLSRDAVRRAHAELQVGALAPEAQRQRIDASSRLIGPATVAEQRLVPVTADQVKERAARFLTRQTFELRRSGPEFSMWRRRDDMAASLRRKLDFTKRIKFAGVRAITVHITEVADQDDGWATLVRVVADLGNVRSGTTVVTVGTPTVLAGAAGVVGAAVGEPTILLAAAGGWVPVTAGAVGLGRVRYRRERAKVAELLASFLDELAG